MINIQVLSMYTMPLKKKEKGRKEEKLYINRFGKTYEFIELILQVLIIYHRQENFIKFY